MTTQLTLRRKLQKKKKRRSYGRCPLCGNRTDKAVRVDENGYFLLEECRRYFHNDPKCNFSKRIGWTGIPS